MGLFCIFYTYLLLEWYIIRRISKVFRKVDLNKKNETLKVASVFTVKLLPKDIQQLALFLDVDGTLYEIENSPSLIKPCFKLQKTANHP